jgi:hypothetical protein
MISLAYGVIALMALGALYAAFRLWRFAPSGHTFLIMLPLLFLWFDNFVNATGKFIGDPDILIAMSTFRYTWHWLMLPLLLIVACGLARRAGFGWAQSKIAMAVFCIAAVAFIIEDVRYIFMVDFYPACFGDTLRYVINVNPAQYCDPANPPPKGLAPAPFATLAVSFSMLLIGIGMWWKHKFPWLALTSAFMIVCGASGGIKGFYLGQIMGNFGEPIFNAGIIAVGFFLARRQSRLHPAAA